MRLDWASVAVMLAMVVAGCVAGYFIFQLWNRRSVSQSERELWHQMHSLANALNALEVRIAEMEKSSLKKQSEIEIKGEAADQIEEKRTLHEEESIAPDTMAAIAAAAVGFAGSKARVRSARMLGPRDAVSPWSQQGRAVAHASHNIRSRGWSGTVPSEERTQQLETSDNN
jgi:hypothetical protein